MVHERRSRLRQYLETVAWIAELVAFLLSYDELIAGRAILSFLERRRYISLIF